MLAKEGENSADVLLHRMRTPRAGRCCSQSGRLTFHTHGHTDLGAEVGPSPEPGVTGKRPNTTLREAQWRLSSEPQLPPEVEPQLGSARPVYPLVSPCDGGLSPGSQRREAALADHEDTECWAWAPLLHRLLKTPARRLWPGSQQSAPGPSSFDCWTGLVLQD